MYCWMLWGGSGEDGEQGNKRGNVVGARVGVQGAGKSGDGTGRRRKGGEGGGNRMGDRNRYSRRGRGRKEERKEVGEGGSRKGRKE